MINIRKGTFETNSSNADVFCIPPSPSLKIPTEIKISRLMVEPYNTECLDKDASVEDKLAFMYNRAEEEGNAAEFIQYLVSKGINVINDVEDTFDYDADMFGFYIKQEDLDGFLFDPESMYIDSPSYDEYKRIPKDFTVLTFHR